VVLRSKDVKIRGKINKATKATMEVCLACIDEAQPIIKFMASTPEEAIFNGLNNFLFDNTPTRRSASLTSLYGKATITRTIDQGFLTVVSFTPSISDVMKKSLHTPDAGIVYSAMDAETWLQMTVAALLCTRHSSVIAKSLSAWEEAQERFQQTDDETNETADTSMLAAKESFDCVVAEHVLCGSSAPLPMLPPLPPPVQNVLYT
jgi:hypothetical protein